MIQIIPPLRLNDKGKQVQNLHFTLFLCLQKSNNPKLFSLLEAQQFTEIFKIEAQNQVFGVMTSSIVESFQQNPEIPVENMPVPASGEIDKPTAEMFNKLLLQYRGLEMDVPPNYPFDTADPLPPPTDPIPNNPPSGKGYKVSGKVFNAFNEPLSGQQVVAYDLDLIGIGYYKKIDGVNGQWFGDGMQKLGEATSDADGYYLIVFHESDFADAEGVLLPDIVSFVTSNGFIAGKSALSTKKDFTDATALDNWNIIISNQNTRGESEYSKLRRIVDPFMEKSKLALHQIAGSEDQIQFVAAETEQDVFNIRCLVNVQKLIIEALQTESEELDAFSKLKNGLELLYGISRQNILLSWTVFAVAKPGDLQKAIQVSIDANIISSSPTAIISKFITALEGLALQLVTHSGTNNKDNEIVKTLSFSLGNDAVLQTKYLSSLKNHSGKATDFWKVVLPQQGFDDGSIKAIQLTNQIGLLTNDHLPLVEELQVNRKITKPEELLVLSKDEWAEIIDKTGIPGKPDGASDDEKNKYIDAVQALLNSSFPNQKVANMISAGDIEIADEKLNNGIRQFLNEQKEFNITVNSFQDAVTKEKLDAIHPEAFEKISHLQRILQVSPTPEALSVLYNENALMSARDIAGIPSVNFIAAYADKLGGEDIASGVHDRAKFLTKRIDQVFMTVYDALHGVNPAFGLSEGAKELLSASDTTGAVSNLVQDHFPDWENLFGSANDCECKDCRSITSPAAYLVDLLQFLAASKPGNVTALDALFYRRPDLGELPLSCENTNTVIPYIDLVNEILEYYVVNGGTKDKPYNGYDTGDTTTEELHANPQNTIKEAYRILSNNSADKKSIYPFTLPYHQPLDRIRIYLEKLQTSRAELMETFRKDADGKDQNITNTINAEILHISPEEYKILTTINEAEVFRYFGYPDEVTMLANITNAQIFIRTAGINYTDLIDVLETRFVNPSQSTLLYFNELFLRQGITSIELYQILSLINNGDDIPDSTRSKLDAILAGKKTFEEFKKIVTENFQGIQQIITLNQSGNDDSVNGCDISKTYLKTIQSLYDMTVNNNGIASLALGKLHRFIRLWRKLGWTIHDLDVIIFALAENNVTDTLINSIAILQRINRRLSLSLEQIACLWGNIDTYGKNSVYNKLFLNKAIKEPDPAFQPDAFGFYFTDHAVLLGDHLLTIQAGMQINSTDLSLILDDYPFAENPALSIEVISGIYRYVLLAKALHISLADLIILKRVSNVNPFSDWDSVNNKFIDINPQKTLDFISMVEKVNNAGFKIPVLDYILNGKDDTGKIQLKPEKTLQTLSSIKDSVGKIVENNPDTDISIADEALLSKKLQLIFTQDTVDSFFNLANKKPYSVTAPAGLLLSKLPPGIQYNSKTGLLQFNGILGDALLLLLQNLKDDNDKPTPRQFTDAVNSLYHKPDNLLDDFIKKNFLGFIDEGGIQHIIADIKKNQSIQKGTIDNLYVEMYRSFLSFLKNTLSKNVVVQMVAPLIDLDETSSDILLKGQADNITQMLSQEGLVLIIDSPAIQFLISHIDTLYRAALFINGFKLTLSELRYFFNNGKSFNNLDFSKLTFDHWSRLADYSFLRKEVAPDPNSLIKIFDAASGEDASIEKIINAGLLDGKILPQLNAWFGTTEVKDFQDEIALSRLNKALKLLQKTGAPLNKLAPVGLPPQVISWAAITADFSSLWDIAEDIKRTLKAKYSNDDWLLLSKVMSNQIRESQKQALISYLLTQPTLQQWGVSDADGLFEYFLIDVQMDACMDTSRIVQALSSIQLFVDRILLNLESTRVDADGKPLGINSESIDPKQWEWRKYYRVWQAAREIYLFPENWLEPEWRDDKSPFFKELESDLLQNDITADSVDTAFRNYLQKLEEVSNLDICGMHQSDPSNPSSDIYIFARTHHTPYHYYWRKKTGGEWKAWEKIQVDIRGIDDTNNPGVHLVPVFWKNRLILFWPEFTQKVEQNSDASSSTDNISDFTKNNKFSALVPDKYWEIRLAWSEYKDKKWQPKVISNEPLILKDKSEITASVLFSGFVSEINVAAQTDLYLDITENLRFYFLNAPLNAAGTTDLISLHNRLQNSIYKSLESLTVRSIPDLYLPLYMKKHRYGNLHLFDNNYLTNVGDHTILYSNQVEDFATNKDLKYPFFFQDAQRVYFVKPASIISYRQWIADPDTVPPEMMITPRFSPSVLIGKRLFADSN